MLRPRNRLPSLPSTTPNPAPLHLRNLLGNRNYRTCARRSAIENAAETFESRRDSSFHKDCHQNQFDFRHFRFHFRNAKEKPPK
jgi:hypothetical protein